MHFSKYILFVIFVFERRTDKRYRCKFPRVTTYNVIDIISHHQCVSIVPHRVRMEAQPERLTHFGIVYGRMRSHIQQVCKVKHIAQFGKFACDITNIFIAGINRYLIPYCNIQNQMEGANTIQIISIGEAKLMMGSFQVEKKAVISLIKQ